jgi:hypothetical protein
MARRDLVPVLATLRQAYPAAIVDSRFFHFRALENVTCGIHNQRIVSRFAEGK